MNYTKSSVKLLKVISQYENKTAFYTEFDGNFNVGDKFKNFTSWSGKECFSNSRSCKR